MEREANEILWEGREEERGITRKQSYCRCNAFAVQLMLCGTQ